MMRDCKRILRELRQMEQDGNSAPTFEEVTDRLKLTLDDVVRFCAYLKEHGRLDYLYQVEDGKLLDTPERITLTLRGKYPVRYVLGEFTGYLVKNWMSLIALGISAAALAVSVFALVS